MITPNVLVRSFKKSEWKAYREIRLRALRESPDAFGSTYQESRNYTDDMWISRLKTATTETDFPMAATIDARIVGLGRVKIEPPVVDVAHLYQMWVAPEARGKGVGKTLLKAAISWAEDHNAMKMLLDVTCGDRPARRLYDAFGFEPAGDPLPVRENSDLLEQPMELMFSVRGI